VIEHESAGEIPACLETRLTGLWAS